MFNGSPQRSLIYPRQQVYVPPYLATGLKQPTFNLPNHDWNYGGQYTITNVHLFQGPTSNLRVSLIGGELPSDS